MEIKHYKDKDSNLYGYAADGSQDHLIGDKTQITAEEIKILANKKAQAAFDALSYAEKRAKSYPDIGDQLDALWKGGAEAEAMKAKIQAVKAKYPK